MAEDRINVNNTDNPAGYSGKGASEVKIDINGVVKELATAIEDSIAGVSQIIAGDNITIDPVGGTGAVTITGSGGATLTDLANDPATTTGLTYGHKAGAAQSISGVLLTLSAGTVGPLPDDTADILIYVDFEGNVQFTASTVVQQCAIRLDLVTTAAGEITVFNDQRTFLNNKAKFFQSAIVDGGFISASGLDLTIADGSYLTGNGRQVVSTGVTLPDNTNPIFVYADIAGNLLFDTSDFPVGTLPIAQIETVAGEVVSFSDRRPFASVPGSWPIGQFISTGGAAGDIVCTGIAVADRLDSVLRFTAGALVSVLTSEFTISGANEINNDDGTDTTGSTLLVTWSDRTP